MFPEQYGHGLVERRGLGYGVMEGEFTRAGTREGFRSGSPKDRAEECMRLILDERVGALMATMGGIL